MSQKSCEFCSKAFNRPKSEPWICPYCSKQWPGEWQVPYLIAEPGHTATTPGNAIGGDKAFRKLGLTREVIGPGEDGGPVLIAACPDQEAAERVKRGLVILPLIRQLLAQVDAKGHPQERSEDPAEFDVLVPLPASLVRQFRTLVS